MRTHTSVLTPVPWTGGARYEDGPKSFYTVYAQLFAALDAEERAATPGRAPAPGFGSSTEAWGEVRALGRYRGDLGEI